MLRMLNRSRDETAVLCAEHTPHRTGNTGLAPGAQNGRKIGARLDSTTAVSWFLTTCRATFQTTDGGAFSQTSSTAPNSWENSTSSKPRSELLHCASYTSKTLAGQE